MKNSQFSRLTMAVSFCATFFASLLGCAEAEAKMAYRPQISIEIIVKHLDSQAKTRTLSAQEKTLLTVARISFDALTVKVADKVTNNNTNAASSPPAPSFAADMAVPPTDWLLNHLTPELIAETVTNEIRLHPKWDHQVSTSAKAKISQNRPLLESTFGSGSYAWAWFLLQLDDKASAKKLLLSGYNEQYEKVLKLKEVVIGFGGTPMGEVEYIWQALEPMCDPSETSDYAKKMKKMQIYVSNLPQSHIVT